MTAVYFFIYELLRALFRSNSITVILWHQRSRDFLQVGSSNCQSYYALVKAL